MLQFYQQSVEEVYRGLNVSDKGLTETDFQARLTKYGLNLLPRAKRFAAGRLLLEQLASPLVYILIIAGLITIAVEEYFDSIVIFVSVAVNVGIGFYQEYSSNKILEKLSRLMKIEARVLRDGAWRTVDSENLVPGDIVNLKLGTKVPADVRLTSLRDFSTSEMILTGESTPVSKQIEPIKDTAVIGDRRNMAFMGTSVENGEATGIVVATGTQAEIGRIAQLTKQAEEEKTPLQERLAKLSKLITELVVIAAVLIIIVGVYEKLPFFEIFITSVAVAVAAIPEGLPAALAAILAVSSQKISKKGGLVKRLIAAESLGSTSIICADKTGTLTEGRMKVEQILSQAPDEKVLEILARANEGSLEYDDRGEVVIKGDSTDQAKLKAYLDYGHKAEEILSSPLTAIVPFDSVNKYIGAFMMLSDNKAALFVSGAPDVLLPLSTTIQNKTEASALTDQEKNKLTTDFERLAGQGYRMIGTAYREIKISESVLKTAKLEDLKSYLTDLTFFGLAALRDPIRPEVKETMLEVKSAGLRVVMVTGDHRLTAMAIGRELGLATHDSAVMDGRGLDKLSDEELVKKIIDIDIFARVDPIHKLRVVKAWKARGESVAVTGDGINDAPAIKTADTGIAVAAGTDVTKEAADLVLLNDSLATIVEAIRQGRTAFNNIKKVVIFLLSNSFTELILILGALVMRIPLPLTAVQILWTNLAEDGLPNFALAFEPPEKKVMTQKPISRRTSILDSEGKFLSFPLGIATDLILFAIFVAFLQFTDYDIEYIRTFIFAALGTDSLFYIFSLRSLDRSVFKINPLSNPFLLIAVIVGLLLMISAVYLPELNKLLDTRPLEPHHLFWVLGLGIYKLLLVELVKWYYRTRVKLSSEKSDSKKDTLDNWPSNQVNVLLK